MCWMTLQTPEILTAEEDILVVKIITKRNKSIYQGYKYKKDKIQPTIGIKFGTDYGYYYVSKGYHSYLRDKITIKARTDYAVWGIGTYIKAFIITKKDNDDVIIDLLPTSDRFLKVQYFKIPKGTRYCVNEQGEVVSETIKMV